ncbi:MAG: tetratricopeptide repeat protein [Planctomycetota bacterium]|nr:MAG: tetratricopeptide repeat protein [Planctomycetota bacterium]REJ88309.1 MAG: tetratricopeptide repeat protein [Planctomycetota bacterium]
MPNADSMSTDEVRRWLPPAWLCGLILVVLGAITYGNNLHGPFIYDDQSTIVENPGLRQLWPADQLVAAMRTVHPSRPLANLTLALNYAWGGLEVRGYHLVNIGVHIVASLLLFAVVRLTLRGERLGEQFGAAANPLALACAAIWLVHPLQSECVNYITQRSEMLMATFFLLTLYAAIRAREPSGRIRWELLAIGACAAGMATKEVMVTAPLIVVLYDAVFASGTWRQQFAGRWRLYLGLAATWGLLAWLVGDRPHGRTAGFGLGLSPWDYALNQGEMVVEYLRLVFWPHPLNLDYGRAVPRELGEVALPGGFVVALLLVTAVALWKRPPLGFLGAWFFLILAPTSSILPILTEVGAERRVYLSLAAPVVLLVVGGWRLLTKFFARSVAPAAPRKAKARADGQATPPRELIVGGLALLILLAVLVPVTRSRNRDYHDTVTIWQTAVAARESNPRAHRNLGFELHNAHRLDEAAASYRRALAIEPAYQQVHFDLGLVYKDLRELAAAEHHLRRAAELNPGDAKALNSLANICQEASRADDAIALYRRALEIEPDHPSASLNLAIALDRQGRPAEAIPYYARALEIRPELRQARARLEHLRRTVESPVP